MTILIYFLPLLVIGCAYTVVGLTLWASEIPGDSSDRYHEQVSAKRKAPQGLAMTPRLPELQEHLGNALRGRMFRVGFKHAFRWCPLVSAGEYEGLELKSARYLQTQSSVYKASRMETTVSLAVGAAEEELEEPCRAKRLSIDGTSNGSSRSDSKTVSESFSFYSNTLT
ncbi:substance-P receptor [Pitangus sulphuratus]|nr:substance-P receptor [Pitangus sulphuratus]